MSKERDWAAEVEAWRASGLSARQYCEEREYSATTLYWWSSHLCYRALWLMDPAAISRALREGLAIKPAMTPIA